MPIFTHHDLELLNPSFDSDLVDVLSERSIYVALGLKAIRHRRRTRPESYGRVLQ